MIFKCTIELIFVKRDLCSRYLAATKLENALNDPNKGLSNFNYLAHVQKITSIKNTGKAILNHKRHLSSWNRQPSW